MACADTMDDSDGDGLVDFDERVSLRTPFPEPILTRMMMACPTRPTCAGTCSTTPGQYGGAQGELGR